MSKKALIQAIEIIWISVGILCLIIVARELFITRGDKAWLFGVMSAVAFLMAGIRHRQRKKL